MFAYPLYTIFHVTVNEYCLVTKLPGNRRNLQNWVSRRWQSMTRWQSSSTKPYNPTTLSNSSLQRCYQRHQCLSAAALAALLRQNGVAIFDIVWTDTISGSSQSRPTSIAAQYYIYINAVAQNLIKYWCYGSMQHKKKPRCVIGR